MARRPAPHATNSWARRTILERANQLGLNRAEARKVGNAGLWFYNRILLLHVRRDAVDQELPPNANRYFVPISLELGCEFLHLAVGLDRILHLSGIPTERTVATAHELLAEYTRRLDKRRSPSPPPRTPRLSPSPTPRIPEPAFRSPVPAVPRTRATHRPRTVPRGPVPASRPGTPVRPAPRTTALAPPLPEEVLRVRRMFSETGGAAGPALEGTPRARQIATNNWARKRISDLCRSQEIPGAVSRRALEIYERVVDLHTARGHAPPGKRLQLSPRLNWSLVYTTIYLGCRLEEFPRDLRVILGPNAKPGTIREIYRLYRFYKRELQLEVHLVDVTTFIRSWIDGFPMSELLQEEIAGHEARRVQERAIAIAHRARRAASLQRTSTKMIAAGALTTVLAERRTVGSLSAFYRAIATFLHMSEEMIRSVVARIAIVLQ